MRHTCWSGTVSRDAVVAIDLEARGCEVRAASDDRTADVPSQLRHPHLELTLAGAAAGRAAFEGHMELVDRARQTLDRVAIASLATVSGDGRPWNCPVFVAFDGDFRFYWSSQVDAVHSQNIAARPDVCLVLFDSTQPDASGRAVYVRALARELTDDVSMRAALACLARRRNEPAKDPAEFTDEHPRRVYVAVPDIIWTNVLKCDAGHFFDERVVIHFVTPPD